MGFPFHQTSVDGRRWTAAVAIAAGLHILLGGLFAWLWVPSSGQTPRPEVTAEWVNEQHEEPSRRAPRVLPRDATAAQESVPIVVPPEEVALAHSMQLPPKLNVAVTPDVVARPELSGPTTASRVPASLPARGGNGGAGNGGDGTGGDGAGGDGTGGGGSEAELGAQGQGGAPLQNLEVPQVPELPPESLLSAAPRGHFRLDEPKWAVTPAVLKGILARLASARKTLSRELRGLGGSRVEVRFRLALNGVPKDITCLDTKAPTALSELANKLVEKGAPYPLPEATATLSFAATLAIRLPHGTHQGKVIVATSSGNGECDRAILASVQLMPGDGQWHLETLSVQATLGATLGAQGTFVGQIVQFQGDPRLRPWVEQQAQKLFQDTTATGYLRLPIVIEEK